MARWAATACLVACAVYPTAGFLPVPTLGGVGSTRLAHRASTSTVGVSVPPVRMAGGLPADFDPMSPVNDHLHLIDRMDASQMTNGGAVSSPQMVEGGGGAHPEYSREEYGRVGPPPDLPSLLLHNRIVYLGMPLVPAVTELIIAQLLYLNFESSTKPVYMYINTPGTSTPDGRSIGFETEAFAISDTMHYIRCPVYTIGVGQAFGLGAMLLASGTKGHRSALPNASIMLHQPRSMARGQASDIAIKAKEVLTNRKTGMQMLARACGKTLEEVENDATRTRYMSPEEAVEYGLIDSVLKSKKPDRSKMKQPEFLDAVSVGGRVLNRRSSLYDD